MKKISGIPPQHTKLRGEVAELRFMTRAAELGLRVIKPWGESSRYDFIVETGGHFLRIQVKSTSCQLGKRFACALIGSKQKPYTAEDIDLFALDIVPIDTWYIIPIQAVCDVRYVVTLSPHNPRSKYAVYKEAWHLLGKETSRPKDK